MKILYTPETENYLFDLAFLLYEKQYFSYFELAQRYVRLLIQDVETTFHLKMKRKASSYFSRYGKDLWYVSYPRNKHTTWYFFFTCYANDVYVIRYISNNHVAGHLLE